MSNYELAITEQCIYGDKDICCKATNGLIGWCIGAFMNSPNQCRYIEGDTIIGTLDMSIDDLRKGCDLAKHDYSGDNVAVRTFVPGSPAWKSQCRLVGGRVGTAGLMQTSTDQNLTRQMFEEACKTKAAHQAKVDGTSYVSSVEIDASQADICLRKIKSIASSMDFDRKCLTPKCTSTGDLNTCSLTVASDALPLRGSIYSATESTEEACAAVYGESVVVTEPGMFGDEQQQNQPSNCIFQRHNDHALMAGTCYDTTNNNNVTNQVVPNTANYESSGAMITEALRTLCTNTKASDATCVPTKLALTNAIFTDVSREQLLAQCAQHIQEDGTPVATADAEDPANYDEMMSNYYQTNVDGSVIRMNESSICAEDDVGDDGLVYPNNNPHKFLFSSLNPDNDWYQQQSAKARDPLEQYCADNQSRRANDRFVFSPGGLPWTMSCDDATSAIQTALDTSSAPSDFVCNAKTLGGERATVDINNYIYQVGRVLWEHAKACPVNQKQLCAFVRGNIESETDQNPLRDDDGFFEHVFPACAVTPSASESPSSTLPAEPQNACQLDYQCAFTAAQNFSFNEPGPKGFQNICTRRPLTDRNGGELLDVYEQRCSAMSGDWNSFKDTVCQYSVCATEAADYMPGTMCCSRPRCRNIMDGSFVYGMGEPAFTGDLPGVSFTDSQYADQCTTQGGKWDANQCTLPDQSTIQHERIFEQLCKASSVSTNPKAPGWADTVETMTGLAVARIGEENALQPCDLSEMPDQPGECTTFESAQCPFRDTDDRVVHTAGAICTASDDRYAYAATRDPVTNTCKWIKTKSLSVTDTSNVCLAAYAWPFMEYSDSTYETETCQMTAPTCECVDDDGKAVSSIHPATAQTFEECATQCGRHKHKWTPPVRNAAYLDVGVDHDHPPKGGFTYCRPMDALYQMDTATTWQKQTTPRQITTAIPIATATFDMAKMIPSLEQMKNACETQREYLGTSTGECKENLEHERKQIEKQIENAKQIFQRHNPGGEGGGRDGKTGNEFDENETENETGDEPGNDNAGPNEMEDAAVGDEGLEEDFFDVAEDVAEIGA